MQFDFVTEIEKPCLRFKSKNITDFIYLRFCPRRVTSFSQFSHKFSLTWLLACGEQFFVFSLVPIHEQWQPLLHMKGLKKRARL